MHNLPEQVEKLCKTVNAPPRLIAHLTLVHDVAIQLIEAIKIKFPNLSFDEKSVLFGAATHDIGKALHLSELSGAGSEHESDGVRLLVELGINEKLARFARTHAAWRTDDSLQLEDLFVALADNCWKGKRPAELENLIAQRIADRVGKEVWDVYMTLDEELQKIAEKADDRLMWQAQFTV